MYSEENEFVLMEILAKIYGLFPLEVITNALLFLKTNDMLIIIA